MKAVPEYQNLYVEGYEKNNTTRTLAGGFLQKSHRLLENSLPAGFTPDTILEVGAGSGHHYSYVDGKEKLYVMTDGSDAMLRVANERHLDRVATGRLRIEKQDATRLGYPDHSFDRLIATHVLEHIPNPVAVLQEWNRVVKPGGLLSIVLPCDPGMLWRFGRYLGPRRNAHKLNLPYDYIQAADHVNSIYNLTTFIRYHFEVASQLWYPLRVPVADINLFYVCHVRVSPG